MHHARRLGRAAGAGALTSLLVLAGGATSGAAGLPPPRFAHSIDIGLVSGVVLVQPPHGGSFTLGRQDRTIPVDSVLDTTRGTVDLRTARAPGSTTKAIQDGQFAGGRFTIIQRAAGRGLSEVDLATPRTPGDCSAAQGAGKRPRVSARVLSMLRATAHGAFRTRGRYSGATVRGTAWNTIERCDGTLTQVHRGVVTVRDFVRHVTVTVRAGRSYLARAP
jgi:hypothetical protein